MNVTKVCSEMTITVITTCYRSVILFDPLGMVVLALVISCCSRARGGLSRRLCRVSSEMTVTSVSECLGLLKYSATPDLSF